MILKWLIAIVVPLLSPTTWLLLEQLVLFIFKTFKTLVIISLELGWKGVPAMIISWLLLSGSGLIGLGFILKDTRLKIIGTTIYTFWVLTAAPLNAAIALGTWLIARFVFGDKSANFEMIKRSTSRGFSKE